MLHVTKKISNSSRLSVIPLSSINHCWETIYFRNALFSSKFSLFFSPVVYGRCVGSKLVWLLFLFSQPYLRNHPGLKERLCCGDITLIFRHTPSLADCDDSILEKVEALKDSEPEVRPFSFPDPLVPLSRRSQLARTKDYVVKKNVIASLISIVYL